MYDNVILITTKKKIAAFLKGNKQLFLVAITGSVRLAIPMGETNVSLCSWTRHLQFNSHSACLNSTKMGTAELFGVA